MITKHTLDSVQTLTVNAPLASINIRYLVLYKTLLKTLFPDPAPTGNGTASQLQPSGFGTQTQTCDGFDGHGVSAALKFDKKFALKIAKDITYLECICQMNKSHRTYVTMISPLPAQGDL